jgi:hypothetical protein
MPEPIEGLAVLAGLGVTTEELGRLRRTKTSMAD